MVDRLRRFLWRRGRDLQGLGVLAIGYSTGLREEARAFWRFRYLTEREAAARLAAYHLEHADPSGGPDGDGRGDRD